MELLALLAIHVFKAHFKDKYFFKDTYIFKKNNCVALLFADIKGHAFYSSSKLPNVGSATAKS